MIVLFMVNPFTIYSLIPLLAITLTLNPCHSFAFLVANQTMLAVSYYSPVFLGSLMIYLINYFDTNQREEQARNSEAARENLIRKTQSETSDGQ